MSLSMDRHLVPGESVKFDPPAQDTLIVGLGNPLRGDDGVGVRVVQLLAAKKLPFGVEVVDGGTQGLELVNLMEGWQRVILVDAANLGQAEGQFMRFSLDETRLLDTHEPVSIHAAGLRDALLLAHALGVLPGEVIVYGVQPANLDWDTKLSPRVEAAVPEITNCILNELEQKSLSVGDESSESRAQQRATSATSTHHPNRRKEAMANEKILVVDDDPDLVEVIRLTLEASGYEVFSAASGAEGLEKVKEVEPDLIVLDVMMDYTTEGFQVSLALRSPDAGAEYAAYRDIPILMLTAIHSTTPLRFGPEEDYLPVDDFVEKPVEPGILVQKIEELLEKSAQ